jgi:hypothetical protein
VGQGEEHVVRSHRNLKGTGFYSSDDGKKSLKQKT